MIMYIGQRGLSPYGLGTSTGQWRGRATCCWTGWTPPSLQQCWSFPSMAPSSPWSSSSPSIITSSPQINTDQVLVSQVETQPTDRRSWSEVCSCRPPGARSYDLQCPADQQSARYVPWAWPVCKPASSAPFHLPCRDRDLRPRGSFAGPPIIKGIFIISQLFDQSQHDHLSPFLIIEQTSVNHIQNLSFKPLV